MRTVQTLKTDTFIEQIVHKKYISSSYTRTALVASIKFLHWFVLTPTTTFLIFVICSLTPLNPLETLDT